LGAHLGIVGCKGSAKGYLAVIIALFWFEGVAGAFSPGKSCPQGLVIAARSGGEEDQRQGCSGCIIFCPRALPAIPGFRITLLKITRFRDIINILF
jgi:hypothetical protein